MEASFFRFLAAELAEVLQGRRIGKIFAPAEGVLTLETPAPGDHRHLLFRPAKQAGLFFLSEVKPANPAAPPARVMWLRKRLSGRRLLEAACDWPSLRLAFALSPGEGTHLLFDLRQGLSLEASLSPDFGRDPAWPELHRVLDDPEVWRDFPQISPPLRRHLQSLPPTDAAAEYERLREGRAPAFFLGAAGPPLPWRGAAEDQEFPTALAAAQAYGDRLLFPHLERVTDSAERDRLKGERKRLSRALGRLDQEEARLKDNLRFQDQAEALQAELWRIKDQEGLETVRVEHPRLGPLDVALNPLLSPTENMAKLFKLAGKAQRGLEHAARRRAELTAALDGLGEPLAGPVPAAQTVAQATNRAVLLPRRCRGLAAQVFRSSDGFLLLRGKNKEANQALATRAASPFDLWFHVQGGPGAHVLLKREFPNQEVPEQSRREAATLAALKSWRANDAKADVICALARDLRSPKGSAPGQVQVDKLLETLRVDLDPDLETRLACTAVRED